MRRGLLAAAGLAVAALPSPTPARGAPLRELRIGRQKNGPLHIDKQRRLIETRLPSEAPGIGLDAWGRAAARAGFAVGPTNPAVVEEQQRIADRFHRLGMIPRRIAAGDTVRQWRPQA